MRKKKGVGGVVEKVYKEEEPKDMVPALICVDTFSKYVSVVLLPEGRKTTPHIAPALMQACARWGAMMKRRAESYQIPYTATEREVWSRMTCKLFLRKRR